MGDQAAPAPPDVCVIGLGHLGTAVARAFLDARLRVAVWNRTAGPAEQLGGRGALAATDLVEAVASAPLLVSVLIDHDATLAVLQSPGVTERLLGRTFVQLAVGGAEQALVLQEHVTGAGADYLGGHLRAYPRQVGTEEAELVVCGGQVALDRHRHVLSALGRVRYVGSDVVLASHLVNCQAVLLETIVVGFHECLAAARARGASPEEVVAGLEQTFVVARRTISDTVDHLRDEPDGLVCSRQAAIDVHAAGMSALLASVAGTGVRSDLGRATLAILDMARDRGLGAYEISALQVVLQQSPPSRLRST
ncbi:NAD(P)-binding domain-containing protein [Nocardioides sp. AN3]